MYNTKSNAQGSNLESHRPTIISPIYTKYYIHITHFTSCSKCLQTICNTINVSSVDVNAPPMLTLLSCTEAPMERAPRVRGKNSASLRCDLCHGLNSDTCIAYVCKRSHVLHTVLRQGPTVCLKCPCLF